MLFLKRGLRSSAGVLALLLATGCGAASGGAPHARSDQLTIVASAYPFQFIAERVAGDHALVANLTTPGQEPHDVELTARQTASVSDADLVIFLKSFQAVVDEAVAQSGNPNVLDAATVIPLQPLAHSEHEHEEGHEEPPEDHDHEAEEGHEDPDHGNLDPHVWLDPKNMGTIATVVAQQLSTIDPAHAADYTDNAANLVTAMTTLDERFATGLASCTRTEFFVTHAAFGYLAGKYGLDQVAVTGLSPDDEPSPARIAEIQHEAREHGVTTIFYETMVSPAVAQTIADDLGLATDVLDPIEGITPQSRGQDYVAVMEANLAALQKANDCS